MCPGMYRRRTRLHSLAPFAPHLGFPHLTLRFRGTAGHSASSCSIWPVLVQGNNPLLKGPTYTARKTVISGTIFQICRTVSKTSSISKCIEVCGHVSKCVKVCRRVSNMTYSDLLRHVCQSVSNYVALCRSVSAVMCRDVRRHTLTYFFPTGTIRPA